MCYKELWQKQKAEKEKKWIDNHKGADVAWCSQAVGGRGSWMWSFILFTSPYSLYKKEYIYKKKII